MPAWAMDGSAAITSPHRASTRLQLRSDGDVVWLAEMTTGMQSLQRHIPTDYVRSIGLAPATSYAGARLRPVVPLNTAVGGILIVVR